MTVKFPSVADVTRCLLLAKPTKTECDEMGEDAYIDVRLQVMEDDSWGIHTGDSGFDVDHRGYWGASSLSHDSNCREVAHELLGEAKEHAAQCS